MLSRILLSFFLWNSAKIKYSNNSVNEICNWVAYELILESVFIFDRQLQILVRIWLASTQCLYTYKQV